MMLIQKSFLRKMAAVSLLIVLATVIAASAASAAGTVTIVTPPAHVSPIYVERDNVAGSSPSELLGTFPVYDGNKEITFSWTPFTFAAGTNGAYRVSLWQNTTPFAAVPTWTQIKVAHHWASNPNGESFTMGSFGFGETVCTTCPTMFTAEPETYVQVYNEAKKSYEYQYTLVGATAAAQQANRITSAPFFIEIFRPTHCSTLLFQNACSGHCDNNPKIPRDVCMADCFNNLIPYASYDLETCKCAITSEQCEAQGGTFIAAVCVCQ